MLQLPDISLLEPKTHVMSNGREVRYLPSSGTDLIKIDFLFEAGSAYQAQKLCAMAANRLFSVATKRRSASEVAEFLDYRGVELERDNDVYQSSLSAYLLRKHADEVLPLLAEMIEEPAFNADDFEVWRAGIRQNLLSHAMDPRYCARRAFYQALYGSEHPLGRYADAADADRLEVETARQHYQSRYGLGKASIVVSGRVDDTLLAAIDRHFGQVEPTVVPFGMPESAPASRQGGAFEQKISGATQTSLRIGRILPLEWHDMDYARFMLLTMALGGYFGSRLMSNLREDKGYTYGVYAQTQIYRGSIVFCVTTDVAGGCAAEAEKEIGKEMEALATVPMGDEELALVKTAMAGDFIRSVDGIFERSTRYCDMRGSGVTEQLTRNLAEALETTTASQIQDLARQLLVADELTVCRAGC